MDDPAEVLQRAEHYRLLSKSVTDDVAIHAMLAMAEDLARRAIQFEQDQSAIQPFGAHI